ncbi:MAG: TDP-N-acetylfucosamine:lipid II N-acetylfucosaminyltransferase [Agriterribacter sp.]
MIDDDFIDYFIEQSESIFPLAVTYWVAKENGREIRKVHSSLIKGVIWSDSNLSTLIKEANKYKLVVVHSFFISRLHQFFSGLSKDIKIVWLFWGADGYSFTRNNKQWFLPKTWKYKIESEKKNDKRLLRFFYTQYVNWRSSNYVKTLIKRVDACATWVKYDFEMIHYLHPPMKWLNYCYFTHQQMGLDKIEPQPLNLKKLWLGNSATETNNHLDALDYLCEINWTGQILIPLSYGDQRYASYVKQYATKQFGDNAIFLDKWMPLDEYHKYMNSCGFVWMNHIRQQAAGNILGALYMGKAVIMNSSNNLFKTFKDWGILFATQNMLHNPEDIAKDQFCKNKSIIENNLTNEMSIEGIKAIYNLLS